jgi:phenylpropionate dioxygenase-like ring-hydroxylating dioxygenase large terminal subunit
MVSHSNRGGRRMGANDFVDADRGLISREIFVSERIFELELKNLFPRCWLFVGHESQIPEVGDYFVSRMGNDSVILTRDTENQVHVLLNSCRHRGMKVCRYDEGNTTQFTCPFHGWSYSVDGSLVSRPGELYGVPHYRDVYGGKLDRSAWGLVNCPKVTSYKGLVFANWDPDTPSFEDYIGDFRYWLDNMADGLDGTPANGEAFRGVQKWRARSNWKLVAENFLGDAYHGQTSHASVESVGIGPGGVGRDRHGNDSLRIAPTSFVRLGHGSVGSVDSRSPHPYDAFPEGEIRNYLQQAWETKVRRYEAAGKPIGATNASAMFPNVAMHTQAFPHSILVAHPVSATETELWRWYMIDRAAPPVFRDWMRHYGMRYSGPAGMTEKDDMENWDYATNASRGAIARRYDYNYEMGIGMTRPATEIEGAVEGTSIFTEENARNYYRRWSEFVFGGDSSAGS